LYNFEEGEEVSDLEVDLESIFQGHL